MSEALTPLTLPVPLQTRIAPAGVTGGTQTRSTITDPSIVNRIDSGLFNSYVSGEGHVQKRPGIEEVAKLLPSVRPRAIAEISGTTADYVLTICDDVLMVNPEPGIKTGERWEDLGPNLPTANKFPDDVKLIAFGNAILAIDGPAADVYSTTNGTTWTALTSAAGWTARDKFGVVATSSFVYVIGGRSGATDRTDVWRSADGITWSQRSTAIPSSGGDNAGSRDPMVAAVGNNLYWGYGGTNAFPNGDVASMGRIFISTDGGLTWASDGVTDFGGLIGPVATRTFPSGVTAIVFTLSGVGNPKRLLAYTIGGAGLVDTLRAGLSMSATTGWLNTVDGRLYMYDPTDVMVQRFDTDFQVHLFPTQPGTPVIPTVTATLSGKPYTKAFNPNLGLNGEGLLLSTHNTLGDATVYSAVASRSPANGFYDNLFPNGFASDDLLQYVSIDQFPPAITTTRSRDEPPFEGAFIKTRRDAYWFNTTDLVLSKVLDEDYPSITTDGVAILNGRVFVATPNGQIHNSEVNAPLDWRAVNFISARSQPDKLVGIARRFGYIGAFGTQSIEWFQDIGTANGTPLLQVDSAVTDYGCASGNTIVNINDTILFLGRGPRTGDRSVYMLNGYQPDKVSTPDIDRLISQYPFTSIAAYPLYAGGHRLYVLDFVCTSVAAFGGGTVGHGAVSLVYDLDARTWYAWSAYAPQTHGSMGVVTRFADTTGYTLVRFTTGVFPAAANDFAVGDLIEVRGAVPTAYNGEWLVYSLHATNNFGVLMIMDPGPVTTTGVINSLRNVPSGVTPAVSDHGVSLRFPISHSAFQLPTSGAVTDAASLSLTFPPNISAANSVFPILARASSSAFFDNWTGRPTAVVGTSVQLAHRSHIEYLIRTAKWDGGANAKKFISYVDLVGDQRDTGVMAWHRHTDDDRRTFTGLVDVPMDTDRPRAHRQGETRRRVYDIRCPDTTQTARLERIEAFGRSDGVR